VATERRCSTAGSDLSSSRGQGGWEATLNVDSEGRLRGPTGTTVTPWEPESASGEPAPPAGPARPLTFVFAVRPAAFASWTAQCREPSVRHGALLTADVVNDRHGVSPSQSVLLQVTGPAAALRAVARRLSIDGRQVRDLRARIAAAR
jgi:hypothetical protein